MIMQALGGALEQSQHFAQAGFPDAETRQALVGYMGCFGGMLHGHHASKDEFVLPYFRERMPAAPFDVLMAHHREMQSLLDEIQAACDCLTEDGQDGEATQALHETLTELSELLHPHIELDEAQFTREALDALWDAQEEARFGQAIAAYMQEHTNLEEIQRCQAILSRAS